MIAAGVGVMVAMSGVLRSITLCLYGTILAVEIVTKPTTAPTMELVLIFAYVHSTGDAKQDL